MSEKLLIIALIILLIILLIYIRLRANNSLNIFNKYIYLDNNGTTQPYPETLQALIDYGNLGNASAIYGDHAKNVITNVSNLLRNYLNCAHVVFTSGASESNNTIIKAVVESHNKPHILITSYEHKTSIDCALQLVKHNKCELDFIQPDRDGLIRLHAIIPLIRENTKLISIISVHNELGSINAVNTIFAYIKRVRPDIICHTDLTQAVNKYRTPLIADAGSLSFHKLHGPTGLGAIVCNDRVQKLLQEYPMIAGNQFAGARGGTENINAIAAAGIAARRTWQSRAEKNARLLQMKNYIIHELQKHYNIGDFARYTDPDIKYVVPTGCDIKNSRYEIVFLGPTMHGLPDAQHSSVNTLLFSVVKYGDVKHHFCNIKLKNDLYRENVIISIGSACNTGSQKPSHVLFAINAPFIIRCGVIRVSLSDLNTMRECKQFVKKLINCINIQ